MQKIELLLYELSDKTGIQGEKYPIDSLYARIQLENAATMTEERNVSINMVKYS